MASYALLNPDFIGGVLDSTVFAPTRYITDNWFPVQTTNSSTILIDIERTENFGLTQAAVPGEESPIVSAGGRKQKQVIAGTFREKVKLTQADLVAIRRPGTLDQNEAGREIMARKIRFLQGRAKDRMEWLNFQALTGSIVINENGINYTVTFPMAGTFTPTVSTLWSNPATAKPISDLRDFSRLARGNGMKFTRAYMNAATYNTAAKTSEFETLFLQTASGWSTGQMPRGMRSSDLANDLMRRYMQDVPQIVVHDEGYHLRTSATAQLTSGTATATVDDANHFAAGDSVTVEAYNATTMEIKTIQSISGNVITFTTNFASTFPVGSTLDTFKRFIADGKVLVMPESMPGANMDVAKLGRFYLAPTEYTPGGLMSPKAGLITEIQIHDNWDPKVAVVIGGFSGMSAVLIRNAHVYATVY